MSPRRKARTNAEIARVLREIGLFLEAEGVSFKPKAYATAADTVESLDRPLTELYAECGDRCVDALPAIGAGITKKIHELVTTGSLAYHRTLREKYPFDIHGMTSIPSIGPKSALSLYKHLGVKTVAALERAARAGKIRTVPGFGRKTEDAVLKGLGFLREHEGRFRIHDTWPFAESIVEALRRVDGVTHCDVAGSIRRREETTGDIDLVATSSKPALVREAFMQLPQVVDVLENGPTYVAVRFRFGINGDLRILKPVEYGSALVHFTGGKEHNILLRQRAKDQGLKLSEYGLFKGKTRILCETEKEVYERLGLSWIPPEIRQGTDEIKRAEQHDIPELLPYDSIRGDLQIQTEWTDGSHSIADMAREVKKRGMSYMAVTDHTQSLKITKGLDEKRLAAQGREIDRVNATQKGFRILKSTECDILEDGSLDLSDKALRTLDLVCVSVHSFFGMEEGEMTERVIRALKHPLVNVFFHPTGRIVNARAGYRIDIPRVARAAAQYHVALEVNGSERLDLRDTHVRIALEAGAKLVVDSDAHRPEQLDFVPFGIATARRGWATQADVLNTLSASAFLKAIRKPKSA